jgi:hypothetical protein
MPGGRSSGIGTPSARKSSIKASRSRSAGVVCREPANRISWINSGRSDSEDSEDGGEVIRDGTL